MSPEGTAMESMPAPESAVTVGVDTHLDTHVAAVIDQAGRLLGTQGFPASTRGYVALVTWAERFGAVERIGVEGTGTYGAGLARFARAYGLQVIEVNRPDRSTRRRRGKSDPIDAQAAARATLARVAATTPKTREGQVEMIRVLRVARRGALKARVAAAEQLHGVLYSAPDELRQPLLGLKTKTLVELCAAMRPGSLTSTTAATKTTLRTLARRWQQLQAELDQLDRQLQALVTSAAPTLVALPGIGVDTAGQLLVTAGDNPQRLRGEAAFAHLCGVSPIPASSGRTDRHRLNRGGDRHANNALWPIALVAMHCHPPTRAYVERRTKQGLSKLDIMRCLKRYIAREVYQHLTSPPALAPGRLPKIGDINEPHQHGHDGAERRHASRPARRIAGQAGYWSWLRVALVVAALGSLRLFTAIQDLD
jgi:transposase